MELLTAIEDVANDETAPTDPVRYRMFDPRGTWQDDADRLWSWLEKRRRERAEGVRPPLKGRRRTTTKGRRRMGTDSLFGLMGQLARGRAAQSGVKNTLPDFDEDGVRIGVGRPTRLCKTCGEPANHEHGQALRGYFARTDYEVTEDTFAREEARRAQDGQRYLSRAPVVKSPTAGKPKRLAQEWGDAPPPGLVCSARLGGVEKLY